MSPKIRHNMSRWEKDAQLEMLLEINTDENIKLKSSATEHAWKKPWLCFNYISYISKDTILQTRFSRGEQKEFVTICQKGIPIFSSIVF